MARDYPSGLVGSDIPLIARIFAIVDVFDALSSRRPYKEAWSLDRALQIMKSEKGSHFDPELIEIFLDIIGPLYERFGGREDISREELEKIIHKYFVDSMEGPED
jgi:HD-GYP domain-containing protein (c-di-GMP phosphodiesterase class II)